jgi:hypothetical protein
MGAAGGPSHGRETNTATTASQRLFVKNWVILLRLKIDIYMSKSLFLESENYATGFK